MSESHSLCCYGTVPSAPGWSPFLFGLQIIVPRVQNLWGSLVFTPQGWLPPSSPHSVQKQAREETLLPSESWLWHSLCHLGPGHRGKHGTLPSHWFLLLEGFSQPPRLIGTVGQAEITCPSMCRPAPGSCSPAPFCNTMPCSKVVMVPNCSCPPPDRTMLLSLSHQTRFFQ